jgi:uncharacterized protein
MQTLAASPNARQRPIDPCLFRWPTAFPVLLASRCSRCAALAFPAGSGCTACGCSGVAVEELPRRGTLWAWTIQRFMPKPPYHSSETPQTFVPFGVGYIEFPGLLRVESRLLENDPQKLKIGSPMELQFYVHRTEQDGTDVINYAFRPI